MNEGPALAAAPALLYRASPPNGKPHFFDR
jgi:hypothetical protein